MPTFTVNNQSFINPSVQGSISLGGGSLVLGGTSTASSYYILNTGTSLLASIQSTPTTLGFFGTAPKVQQSGDLFTALENYGLMVNPSLTMQDLHGDVDRYKVLAGPTSSGATADTPAFRFLDFSELTGTTNVTTQGNTFNGANQLVQLNSSTQLPALDGSLLTNLTKTQVGLSNVTNDAQVKRTEMGTANGVATLDSGGHVPTSQLPAAALGALSYQGTWNANTNSPSITTGSASSANKGYYYIVSVAGSTTVDGISTWHVGDWITSDGTLWDKVDNYQLVSSVAGKTGVVTLNSSDVGLGSVPNVDATNASNISSGTLSDLRLSTNVTVQGNSFNGVSQLVQTTAAGKLPAIDGSLLTNMTKSQVGLSNVPNVDATNASNITTGTLDGARMAVFGASGSSHAPGAVPDPGSSAGTTRYLREDGTWSGVAGAAGGTVTSVDLSTNAGWFTVGGNPITGAGTITLNLTSGQTGNRVLASPDGTTGTVSLRALVAADIPSLDASKITTGNLSDSRLSANVPLLNATNAFTGSNSFSKDITFSGEISPTALSGDVNDYNPTGASTAFTIRIDGGAADRNITGLANGSAGRILRIVNIGTTNNLILVNQSTSSTAGNRFLLPNDTIIPINTVLTLVYDGVTSRWRAFSRALSNTGVTAGNYGSGTQVASFTVDAAGRLSAASNVGISSTTIAGTTVAPGGSITLDTITGVSSNGLIQRTGANTLAAITAGTSTQYLKGDFSLGTLNQAAVAGLTTGDSPTFSGLSVGTATITGNGLSASGTNDITLTSGGTTKAIRAVGGVDSTGAIGTFHITTTGHQSDLNIINAFVANQANAENVWINWGTAATANNAASIGFHRTGAGSANNYMTMALFAGTPFFAGYPSGGVVVGTSSPTDPGTGNLTISGGTVNVNSHIAAAGTITNSTPVINSSQTWNASGTSFEQLILNVTSTARNNGSRQLAFKSGGTTRLSFGVVGFGSDDTPTIQADQDNQIQIQTGGGILLRQRYQGGSTEYINLGTTGVKITSGELFGWTGSTTSTSTLDTSFTRISAAKVGVGNGTAGDTSGTIAAATYTAGTGVAPSFSTTAAAQTASTTAGVGLTITADNAVAGSTNAGAAAGGSVTITAGNAARLTSGNAAGGDISLVTGTGIGSGLAGRVLIPNGSTSSTSGASLSFTGDAGNGWAKGGGGEWEFFRSGNVENGIGGATAKGFYVGSAGSFAFSSLASGSTLRSNIDTMLSRNASGAVENNSGTIGKYGQFLTGVSSLFQLATPGAPTVTPTGTTGSTSITYKIVAKLADGTTTDASSGTQTTTANATLTGTNYNAISWSVVTGATSYDVYRTATNGTSPTTTGKIGNTTSTSLNDTGLAGDSATAPTFNNTGSLTGGASNGTNIVGRNIIIEAGASTGNVAGGDIIFASTAAGSSGTSVNAYTTIGRWYASGGLYIGSSPSDPGAGKLTLAGGFTAAGASTIGTGNAFTAGSIELGNASDTTISRSPTGGQIAVEGVNVVTVSSTDTLTNKRITQRVESTTSTTSWTPNWDSNDMSIQTALAGALTINNPTYSTTNQGDMRMIRIKDNGTARAISWGTNYRASSDLALPTTTVISKTLYMGFIYNSTDSKWDLLAVLNNI